MDTWDALDRQMQPWGARLRDDLGLSASQSDSLASTIASEVGPIEGSVKEGILRASPISVSSRLEELVAFQAWMDVARQVPHPAITRAQVITQNYVCFVYLKETWFEALRNAMPNDTATFRCCDFLLSEPVRRFRNAFAHGNWHYREDFSGLVFWARAKGSGKTEVRSEVSEAELNFWQMLSRCTAYASMVTLAPRTALVAEGRPLLSDEQKAELERPADEADASPEDGIPWEQIKAKHPH